MMKFILSKIYVLLFSGLTGLLLLACANAENMAGQASAEQSGFSFFGTDESKPRELAPVDYTAWCENNENGLKQLKEIGEFEYDAFLKPIDYMVLKELNNNTIVDQKKFTDEQKEYEGMIYFSFRIKNTKQQDELMKINLSSSGDYYARLEYTAFKMQDDFKLIAGNDTIPCGLYHYERVFGLAPHATFVLGFPSTVANREVTLWYQDKLFNNGIIMLNFKKEVLQNVPKLKL